MRDHGFAARRFSGYHDRRGNRVMFGQDNDLVVSRSMIVRAGFPSRRGGRTRLPADPAPAVMIIEPAFIIRDVFILIKNKAVLRDRHRFRAGHDDLLFNDRGRSFHDDRSGPRFQDSPYQIYDVGRKLNAVAWTGFVMISGEGCGSEDDRSSESSADNKCLVDGLLDRVSYGKRFGFCFAGRRLILAS